MAGGGAPIWRPDWPAPAHVQACFTTRGTGTADGASAPPCDFFNLGDHVGDAPEAVRANRLRLQHTLRARPVFMNQVHGVGVLHVQPDTPTPCTWFMNNGRARSV